MEILIDLNGFSKEVSFKDKKEIYEWKVKEVVKLLQNLTNAGYEIHSNFGIFVFDGFKQKIIDLAKPGELLNADEETAKRILLLAKMAVIYTDEKYIVFDKSYYLATHFCHLRKRRPISPYDVNENFEELITNENEKRLFELYFNSFADMYGRYSKPVKLILNLDEPITRNYWAEDFIVREKKDA